MVYTFSSSSSLDGITFVTIYANCEINGNNIIVFTALNVACANAIVNLGAKLKLNCTPAINLVNGAKNIKNITVPITLNKTWDNATLLVGTDAPKQANIAVIVVPIVSPKELAICFLML